MPARSHGWSRSEARFPRITSSVRTAAKRHKWSSSPDKAWHAMAFNSRSVGLEMAGYAEKGFAPALLAATARVTAYLCHHLQIPIRHARGDVGPGVASHRDLGQAGGSHNDPSMDPEFMQKAVAMVADQANKHDFPRVWEPERPLKACLLTPKMEGVIG